MINGIQQKGFILAVWLGFKCASVVTSYQYSNQTRLPSTYLRELFVTSFLQAKSTTLQRYTYPFLTQCQNLPSETFPTHLRF